MPALLPLLATLQQLVVGLRAGERAVEDLHIVAAKKDCLGVQLDVLESVVLNVEQRVHKPSQEGEQLLLSEVLLIPKALRNHLPQRGSRPLQEDMELIVIGAELFPFQFGD